eukprot:CAMPEP_0172314484 /NCGR_PEP_ID=MMETSP1058-20130122/22663_1 /TAXON_ID=83371 /ORGANISM="Detonula confervacea, Strain CCMP 353" /LENGTH=388 /DNA_ID=CAMNT_0013028369 /DNA_START=22 /DNA_END=1188 /DNA_ORIENTATION=+
MTLLPNSPHRRYGIVVMAVSCASLFQPTAVNAYSFVSSSHRTNLQYSSNKLSLPSSPTLRRQTSASLVMKRPNRIRRPTDKDRSNTQLQQPTELPANLKRKVDAKRPTLGHVVPKKSNTRQHKPLTELGGSNTAQLRPQGQSRDTQRYNNASNLRVLGGSIRGRKLESPNVYLRPMMGKVKEAVYSTFTSFGMYEDVGGVSCKTRHLDIFSGSGSVGLESLSRGAWHCTFVDMSNDCCGASERNIERCGFDGWNEGGIGTGIPDEGEPTARVVCSDAFRALRQPESVGIPPGSKYDIVTLCPPYEEIVYADLLEAVANSELVTEDTVVMVEYPVELGCLPHVIGREDGGVLVGVRNRKYGRTVIAMYVVNPTGDREVAFSRPEEFVSI